MGFGPRSGAAMPTASEFRSAAAEVSSIAESVSSAAQVLGSVAENSGFIGRSMARSLIEDTIGAAQGDVPTCANMLREVAKNLLWRAQVCDAYAADLARWREMSKALAMSGAAETMSHPAPEKPYPWVDA